MHTKFDIEIQIEELVEDTMAALAALNNSKPRIKSVSSCQQCGMETGDENRLQPFGNKMVCGWCAAG